MGEIVGVFYNKDKVAVAADDVRRVRAVARRRQGQRRGPDRVRQPRQVAGHPRVRERTPAGGADKQAMRDFVFGQQRRLVRPRRRSGTRPPSCQEWAKKGYFTPDFNGTGYDPAWQRFAKGKGRFLIAGTWLVADLDKPMGDKVGFMLMPGQKAGGDADGARRREPAVRRSPRSPSTPTSRPRTSTSSPTRTRPRCWSRRTTCRRWAARARSRRALPSEVFAAWKQLSDADGLIPYLDYTTPTVCDEFTGAIQKLLAGKSNPKAFTADVQADYEKFVDSNQ